MLATPPAAWHRWAGEFWLLEAPDSLAAQSHRNPGGAGIGVFGPGGAPRVDKQPIAAWQDAGLDVLDRRLAQLGHLPLYAVNLVLTTATELRAPFPAAPRHLLSLDDPDAAAAASQHHR